MNSGEVEIQKTANAKYKQNTITNRNAKTYGNANTNGSANTDGSANGSMEMEKSHHHHHHSLVIKLCSTLHLDQ